MSQFAFLQGEWSAVFDAVSKAEAAVHADPRERLASTPGARWSWR